MIMKAKNNEHLGESRYNKDHVAAFVERALGVNMADELAEVKAENEINKAAAANSYREWLSTQDQLERHERSFAHYLKYCEGLETDMLSLMKMLEMATATLTQLITVEVKETSPKQFHGKIVQVPTGRTLRPAEETLRRLEAVEKGMQT